MDGIDAKVCRFCRNDDRTSVVFNSKVCQSKRLKNWSACLGCEHLKGGIVESETQSLEELTRRGRRSQCEKCGKWVANRWIAQHRGTCGQGSGKALAADLCPHFQEKGEPIKPGGKECQIIRRNHGKVVCNQCSLVPEKKVREPKAKKLLPVEVKTPHVFIVNPEATTEDLMELRNRIEQIILQRMIPKKLL